MLLSTKKMGLKELEWLVERRKELKAAVQVMSLDLILKKRNLTKMEKPTSDHMTLINTSICMMKEKLREAERQHKNNICDINTVIIKIDELTGRRSYIH